MPGITRSTLISVAVPSEHGGWSLTLEPALLAILVAPSVGGAALAIAGLLVFLIRTPLKLALVDQRRGRHLERSLLARRVVGVELLLLACALGVAIVASSQQFWWPFVVASPMAAVEIWYDIRSRSRRLTPELMGAVGVGSIAAAIALAGGESNTVAAGLWCVVAARAVATIPFVRVQLRRAKGQALHRSSSDLAQAVALGVVLVGWALDAVPVAAVLAIAVLGLVQLVLSRARPPTAAVVGAQQVGLGLGVVLTAALGFMAP